MPCKRSADVRVIFAAQALQEKKTLHATEGETLAVEEAREAWLQRILHIDPSRFVFVDETGVNLGMTRRYARAEGESRAHGSVPKNPGENVSLIGSIRLDGTWTGMHFPGSLDGEAFRVYVEDILIPSLRPNDIVVMDNLNVHKNPLAIDAIRSFGADLWFLPPYSPHLNPIEECWSKFKTLLRSIGARTKDALDNGITQALKHITANDAQGWFGHSGYI